MSNQGKVRARVVSGKFGYKNAEGVRVTVRPDSPDPFVLVNPNLLKDFRGVLQAAPLEAMPELRTVVETKVEESKAETKAQEPVKDEKSPKK